jgi:hypothetical protein
MTRKKTHFFSLLGLTFPDFSGIIFEVSERSTMKNQMTISEIRRHFEERRARDAKRLEAIKKAGKKVDFRLDF